MAKHVDEPPKGISQYAHKGDVPNNIKKYWDQRRVIFSRFDEGIWMTERSWFGVTPEPVANKIADELKVYTPGEKTTLIDAFAGVGGNTIAFALSGRWKLIYAVEQDEATFKCLKHNAKIYGVLPQIIPIKGDVFDVLNGRLKDKAKDSVIFASPPWGGPDYTDVEVYDVNHAMEPYGLERLYYFFRKYTQDLALFLPRNSDLDQIAALAAAGEKFEIVHYALWGASKGMCFYSGNLASG